MSENPNQRKHMSLSLSSIFGRQKKPPHNVSEPTKTQKKSPQNQKIHEVTLKTMTAEQSSDLQENVRIHLNRGALEQQLAQLDQREAENNKKLAENNKKLAENNKEIINARAGQVLGRQMAVEGRQEYEASRQKQEASRQRQQESQQRQQASQKVIQETTASLNVEIKEFIDNMDEFITYYTDRICELDKNDEFFAPLSSILKNIKEAQTNIKNSDVNHVKARVSLAETLLKQAEEIDIKIDSR
jgi:hypothetical protein